MTTTLLAQQSGWDLAIEMGLPLAITGMLIVFAVLILIAMFLGALPRILQTVNAWFPESHHGHQHSAGASRPAASGLSDELIAAIGMALHHTRHRD